MSAQMPGFATTDDGCRLHYRIDGGANARTLVLHNSIGTNPEMWDAQIEAFAKHFRVVRFDTRGHGAFDAPPGPYTIARLGADVLTVLDEIGAERVSYCGISLGG